MCVWESQGKEDEMRRRERRWGWTDGGMEGWMERAECNKEERVFFSD